MTNAARSIAAACVAAAFLAVAPASAQDKTEQTFVTKAIQGNLAEVQIGHLAQTKATDSNVRDFGAMLIKDHSANNQKAEALAQALHVTPPTGPNAEQKRTYDRLSKLSGSAFDREFAADMISDHRKDITEFDRETKSSNAQIASYANATLPDLKKHLQTAEALSK